MDKAGGAKESIKETAAEAKDYAKEKGSNVADRGRGKFICLVIDDVFFYNSFN